MPTLLIIGGSNGGGKTTFAKPYVARRQLPFLNADELTREFESAGESQALVKAGRAFLAAVAAEIEAGRDFAMETTLSGGYVHGVVSQAQAAGYRVELVYLFVASPEQAVARWRSGYSRAGTTCQKRRYEGGTNAAKQISNASAAAWICGSRTTRPTAAPPWSLSKPTAR